MEVAHDFIWTNRVCKFTLHLKKGAIKKKGNPSVESSLEEKVMFIGHSSMTTLLNI